MSELLAAERQLFFDPFADAGEELFDPAQAHQAMWERYAARDVEHDYTSDHFVADTQALMLDAQFVGQFEQAQLIAQRMHMLCGEDHGLRESLLQNNEAHSMISGLQRDVHNHSTEAGGAADKKDSSTKKKKKKKRKGWFGVEYK